MFHAEQHAEYVGFECSRVSLRRLRGDGAWRSFSSRIVHSYVEPAKPFHCLIDERLNLWFVPNIGLYKLRFDTQFAQFLFELFAILLAAACDHQIRASRCKSHSRCTANAGKRSCDENNLFRHSNSLSVLMNVLGTMGVSSCIHPAIYGKVRAGDIRGLWTGDKRHH